MATWMKLDNAAKIYPPAASRHWQYFFRLSVTLTEAVDPGILAQAQVAALKRFPSFACRLRRGFFWYYLEQVDGAPPVTPDTHNPMRALDPKVNGPFTYRLLYWQNRIAIEFYHVVADGTGGMTFLLSLVNEYLRLAHGVDASPAKFILSCAEEPRPEESEDGFARYAGTHGIASQDKAAWQPRGSAVPLNRLLITVGTVPADALAAKAKEYGATVGVFLNAVLINALYRVQQREPSARRRRQDVKVCVPINLRRFFPSETVRNFAAFVNLGISPKLGEYTFEEIVSQVGHYMGMHVTEKELRAWMTYNVAAERNPFVRAVPLFLKKPLMSTIYKMQGDRYSSSTLSNFGVVRIPDALSPCIDRVDFILGRAYRPRCQCACVTAQGKTAINFSRTFAEADIEREFFSQLVELGIPVEVESNTHGALADDLALVQHPSRVAWRARLAELLQGERGKEN